MARDLLVIRLNHCNAGFFAQVQVVLNQLGYAERKGMTPVVQLGPDAVDGPNPFYDADSGPNVWEYYFEPVDGVPAATAIAEAVKRGQRVLTLEYWELWRLHNREPRSVFTYPYGYYKQVKDKSSVLDEQWWAKQRDKGRRLVSRYVRVKPDILEKVEAFIARNFEPKMLGVHARGTDKQDTGTGPRLARIISPAEYFPHIDHYLTEHPQAGIFFATDQRQFREEMKSRYGNRLVTYAEQLSESSVNVFQVLDAGSARRRQKGEEVLIDALLLSRCDFLLKCTSAVGEFAHYFSPTLRSTDLNVQGAPPEADSAEVWQRIGRTRRRTMLRLQWFKQMVRNDWFGCGLENGLSPSRPARIKNTNRFTTADGGRSSRAD